MLTRRLICSSLSVELAAWRPVRHMIGRQYMMAYFNYFPVSAPEEDQDDRNMLYYL